MRKHRKAQTLNLLRVKRSNVLIQAFGKDATGDRVSRFTFADDEGRTVPVTVGFDPRRVVGKATIRIRAGGVFADLDLVREVSGEQFSFAIAFRVLECDHLNGDGRDIKKASIVQIGLVLTAKSGTAKPDDGS